MSFKLFIYYGAVCGGWAAFAAWVVVELFRLQELAPYPAAIAIGGVAGLVLAVAVGAVDALLNAVGRQRWLRVGVCLLFGLMGGLVGGLVGQRLRDTLSSLTTFPNWLIGSLLPGFLGWTAVGTVIGAAAGVFDVARAVASGRSFRPARRKLLNGVIGGALGGAVGGVLFECLRAVLSKHSSLAVGLVALGVSVGLLIGLAQVILREAWVKVEKGFRAGREMMLSKAETTIGRAESCDIGLFGDTGVERTHARIVLQGRRYLLADAGSAAGTFLNDQPVTEPTPLHSGDVIRVGHSLLRFGERRAKSAGPGGI